MRSCLVAVMLLAAVPAPAGEPSARPRLCPEDAPEGVRLPPRRGCDRPGGRTATAPDGFRDLGNGVKLKIGGRVGAEYDVRR
ncbi:hypothetical protein [Methylobacterium nigriterrae]|uniref:hypothetical protein n=1 Tax=Methylobacterium nigriterrae TaxID=3127512 RepID=UPI003013AB3F